LIRQYQTLAPLELQQTVDEGINNALATLRANAITYLTGIGNWLVNTVINVVNTLIFLLGFAIVPFWLFYVLYDQKLAVATLDAMIPRAIRADVWNIWALIDRSLLGYIRGQLLLGRWHLCRHWPDRLEHAGL
jgi:predicted PurR-regulated permease PerM